jgi:LysM repeat protein
MLSSGNGRHRRPRPTPAAVVTVATAAATGAGIAIPLLGATVAQAADNGTWDKVAVCETGGLWSANTGNGFYGGLAITQATWDQYGGDAYAPRPDLASRAQQITVAEKILADLGPDAWPGCETGTGLADDRGTPDVDPGTPSATPTLPGMPLPTLPDVPVPTGFPTGVPGASGSPSAGATTPATPSAGSDDSDGSGTSGGSDDTSGSGGGNGSDATGGSTGSTDTTGTGGSNTDPGGPLVTSPAQGDPSAPTGTPGAPSATSPSSTPPSAATPSGGAATPSGPSAGSGRHAKPYSPTDEQLAAADRASRTELYSVTGKDDPGTSGRTDTGTPGNGDNANKGDKSGTSPANGYTVDLGDTLSSIAAGHHVDGGWRALYDTNRQVIGADPNLIKPGQILNLG